MENPPYLRTVQEIVAHSNGKYKPALYLRAKRRDASEWNTLVKYWLIMLINNHRVRNSKKIFFKHPQRICYIGKVLN
jgi:hypothetical protein